jgi:hypothetical protein
MPTTSIARPSRSYLAWDFCHLATLVPTSVTRNVSEQWPNWGRFYDHNFMRFFPIFGEKFFLEYQCYDQLFSKFSFVLSKITPIFSQNFSAKIFKNHNIDPWSRNHPKLSPKLA